MVRKGGAQIVNKKTTLLCIIYDRLRMTRADSQKDDQFGSK